jgi:hypothetical protein
MRNNIFLTALFAALSLLSAGNNVGAGNNKYKSDQKDRAILRILHYRNMYMPSGVEKIKNDSFLITITDELSGSLADRIKHLKVHGLKPGSTREAAMRLAEKYLVTNS